MSTIIEEKKIRLNSGQERQLIRELSPKFEKAFEEVRETEYSSFIENSIQAVGDGAFYEF